MSIVKTVYTSLLLAIVFLVNSNESARILAVFPMPSISHQVVFRAYTQELAKRGHELVIITPDPYMAKDRPPDNITEIDVSKSYLFLRVLFEHAKLENILKRGVICDVSTVTGDQFAGVVLLVKDQFQNEEIQKLIHDKNQHFDLIVVEGIISYPLIFAKYFDAPLIQFSSLYGLPENYETIGAVARHPLYHPYLFRNKFRDYSFWEKLNELYLEIKLMIENWKLEDMETKYLKEQFGSDTPDVRQLKNRVELLFVNSHPLLDNNRPVPPNVVYLGALQLQPVKELPQDLKSYLDNSKRGVIYVSLGTNVRPSEMDKDFLDAFVDAFEELPFDILWKFDGDHLERVPSNVRIQKWFPQRDLLTHPSVKLFVTQGGLQSTDEAIDASVPLVGIPILADQWYNVNKYVELGIGVEVDALTMTKDDLVKAVKTVIGDESYKKNITRLRAIMRDQPQSPLERAVWWTEYVLRHGGARHLRAPAANVAWAEYLMLDVVIPVIIVLAILLTVLLILCYVVFKNILKMLYKKEKLKRS